MAALSAQRQGDRLEKCPKTQVILLFPILETAFDLFIDDVTVQFNLTDLPPIAKHI